MELPQLRATFDGNPNRLVVFLNQAIAHLDHYALAYRTQRAMVDAVVVGLEGEAAEWVADLHDENA